MTRDTNIMDSNTLVMTVPLSVLGLDPNAESTEIFVLGDHF